MKQTIVMRRDLGMRPGKMAAQAAHASMLFILEGDTSKVVEWRRDGMTKVVLRVDSEAELMAVIRDARKAGLECHAVVDAARTQLDAPTMTCCAVGPDEDDRVDMVTGHLRLML